MKVAAALFLAVPVLWLLAQNTASRGSTSSVFVLLSYVCFAAGTWWGFTKGTMAGRPAVALSAVSLVLFFLAMSLAPGDLGGGILYRPEPPLVQFPRLDPLLAAAATVFLVVGVMQWVRACRAQGQPTYVA